MPVGWERLEQALDRSERSLLHFDHVSVIEDLRGGKDQFAPALTEQQTLPVWPPQSA
jgi:hypothetical protein